MILPALIALLACAWLAGRLGRRRLRLAGVALAYGAKRATSPSLLRLTSAAGTSCHAGLSMAR